MGDMRMVGVGEVEEGWHTTTAICDYFLDSVLATEGMLHGIELERVAGPKQALSMGGFRSQPRSMKWKEIEVGQLGHGG